MTNDVPKKVKYNKLNKNTDQDLKSENSSENKSESKSESETKTISKVEIISFIRHTLSRNKI